MIRLSATFRTVINPNNPLGHEPTVGASLLAKNFASKLAPTKGKASNGQSGFRQQRGSTLLVALIMLVLLTLVAVSAINSTTSSVQMVGNAQFREEANAAAQQAIEQVLSSTDFMTTAPVAQNIDVNRDGTADYTVTFAPAPACLSAKTATYGEPGVPAVCSSSIGAVCFWTVWEIRAVVSDPGTGAAVTVRQGIKTITGLNAAVASCGI